MKNLHRPISRFLFLKRADKNYPIIEIVPSQSMAPRLGVFGMQGLVAPLPKIDADTLVITIAAENDPAMIKMLSVIVSTTVAR